MPRKLKTKFDISPEVTTPPLNTSDYWGCAPMTGGEWREATRNDTVPSDNQGRGWTGKVYVGSGSKLCAPDPPFHNDDGGFGGRSGKGGNKSSKGGLTPAKKAPAKKAPAKKASVEKVTVKKVSVKKVTAKKAVAKGKSK